MKAKAKNSQFAAGDSENEGRKGPHDVHRAHSDALFSYACQLDVRKMPRQAAGFGCSKCRKAVVDTSEMTLDQAAALVRAASHDLCVSYSVVEDGRIAFRSTNRGRLAIGLATFLAACSAPKDPGDGTDSMYQGSTNTADIPAASPQEAVPAEEFQPVHPPVSLSAPVTAATKDSWPSAAYDSPTDDKRHLPVLGSDPRPPASPPRPVHLPGGVRPPSPQPDEPTLPPPTLTGRPAPPPLAGKPAPPQRGTL